MQQQQQSKQGIREFLAGPAGKATGVAVVLAGIALAGWSIYSSTRDAASDANTANFIDAESGKTFSHTVQVGERLPLKSPYSGKNTGYPAEMCWWNKDGSVRKSPYLVLLNQYAGKSGPTFCPDCGRLVVAHNPPGMPGAKPPPTQAEYAARNQSNNREE